MPDVSITGHQNGEPGRFGLDDGPSRASRHGQREGDAAQTARFGQTGCGCLAYAMIRRARSAPRPSSVSPAIASGVKSSALSITPWARMRVSLHGLACAHRQGIGSNRSVPPPSGAAWHGAGGRARSNAAGMRWPSDHDGHMEPDGSARGGFRAARLRTSRVGWSSRGRSWPRCPFNQRAGFKANVLTFAKHFASARPASGSRDKRPSFATDNGHRIGCSSNSAKVRRPSNERLPLSVMCWQHREKARLVSLAIDGRAS